MKSCGMSTIKYLLFAFNLVFALSGLAVLIAGTLVLADVGEFSHFVEGAMLTTPVILIIVGIIVFVIAFLGCYGAIKEHYTLLLAFAGILAVIFIIEMTVGITAAVYKGDFSTVLKGALRKSMKNYTNIQADKIAWDNVQTKLDCCGVERWEEWTDASPNGEIPLSCCKYPESNECKGDNQTIRKNGCFSILAEKVRGNANLLIFLGIGIALIEIAGIVLAGCLAMAIKNENKE